MQLEMEKVSLGKEATSDRSVAGRLQGVQDSLSRLKRRQSELSERWQQEKEQMDALKNVKEEISRVELEIAQAERDYDLNRAAELKYGTLPALRNKLAQTEAELQQLVWGDVCDCWWWRGCCITGFYKATFECIYTIAIIHWLSWLSTHIKSPHPPSLMWRACFVKR